MNKIYTFLLLVISLFILSACGSSSPATEVAGNTVSNGDSVFTVSADPIRVTPTLDAARQVETLISVSGGSLTVTGGDGTLFQLDIPGGALVTDTLIRMTPVSQLDGMPFGSNPYAVQLEPEGLQFYAPAILTITPAQQIPIDQQIFFTYQGMGENLTLALPVVDSPEIKLELPHFSGYGVTKGLLADIEPVRARIGGTAEARLQASAAEELSRARQAALLGGESESVLDLTDYFRQYEQQVIQPRIAAAGESCAAGRLAIQTVLGYERQRQLLGHEGGAYLFDPGLMDTVANVCMKEEFELCRDEHIIHRIIPAWLGLERQYQLLGFSEDGATVPVLESAKTYVRQCLTFELQFESQGDFDDGFGGGYTSAVQSRVKIQLDPSTFANATEAPLVNTAYEFIEEGCSVNSQRGGGTFAVSSLAYITDTHSPTDALGYVRDFKLIYFPGNTSETTTITCEDSPPFTMPASPMWTGIFVVLHESELSMTEGGFLAEGWEIFGDEYFAKKEWIREDAGLGLTEAGTFKLYHKPEAGQ